MAELPTPDVDGYVGGNAQTCHTQFLDFVEANSSSTDCDGDLSQALAFEIASQGWLIDAIEVMVVAFIMEDVAATFNLSSFSKGLVGSASFFGMLFGVMFWSVYADKYGRRGAFVLTLACIFVSGVASSLAPSFSLLLLCRTAVGFGVGGNLPVTSALVTEFLPTKDRAKIMCYISGVFWGCGLISASLLGLLLYKLLGRGHDENMWRWYLGLAAAPAAIVGIAYRFLPESARYLSVVGRNDEALKVLEEIARVNGKLHLLGLNSEEHVSEVVEARLKPDHAFGYKSLGVADSEQRPTERSLNNGTSVESVERDPEKFFGRIDQAGVAKAGSVRDLFRMPVLRRVTICVWMFWLFINISYYGYSFVLPKYYQDIVGDRGDLMYVLTALSGSSMISASFVAMWLCTEDRLGRVGTLMWSSFATALCMLLQALCCDFTALFVPLSVVTMLAIGVIAPIMAEVLFDRSPALPLVVFCPIMILAGVCAGLIPVETAGRKLDDDSWDCKSIVLVKPNPPVDVNGL